MNACIAVKSYDYPYILEWLVIYLNERERYFQFPMQKFPWIWSQGEKKKEQGSPWKSTPEMENLYELLFEPTICSDLQNDLMSTLTA
tara:strand:- start:2778 stop:3038 length:261 start_codon:yes stop_codon:yes gene_type:complete